MKVVENILKRESAGIIIVNTVKLIREWWDTIITFCSLSAIKTVLKQEPKQKVYNGLQGY